jgi:diguanylate cyclase (GGDEF)-like protein
LKKRVLALLRIDWSNRGWARVIVSTILGTAFCIGVAFYVDSFNFASLSPEALQRAYLVNTLVPAGLAGPLLFLFTYKLRQLAIAHHQMSILATTDSLTAVLNRGAFTMLVDAYLKQARTRDEPLSGALLVVDADHFKEINDRHGHESGDVALKEIARSIRSALRGPDIVGRIGGEEFGVFLPGAGETEAGAIAERVRGAVEHTQFLPGGTRQPLTVSVGGATFRNGIAFSDLFRVADRNLYAAKASGRNRVNMGSVELSLAA